MLIIIIIIIIINIIIPKEPHQYRKINVVTLLYNGEPSEKIKRISRDYDISTQFTAVNILVHPKDKQQQRRQSDVVYEICRNPNFACQDAYIGETSKPLQHRLKQHCRSSYNGNDSTVFKHITASGHQINVNDVTILDRDKNWFEHGVKEAVSARTKNPSLNSHGGTRITLSHFLDHSINTLRSLSLFLISSGSKNSTGRQHQHQLSEQPQP